MLSSVRDLDVYLLGSASNNNLPLLLGSDALGAYGPAEAVQRFVVRLFTRRGSIVTDPSRGTDFLRLLKTGRIRTEADLAMAFNSAAHDVLVALAGEGGDDDETPVEATLSSTQVSPDAVRFSVVLRTAAGRLTTFEMPVAV